MSSPTQLDEVEETGAPSSSSSRAQEGTSAPASTSTGSQSLGESRPPPPSSEAWATFSRRCSRSSAARCRSSPSFRAPPPGSGSISPWPAISASPAAGCDVHLRVRPHGLVPDGGSTFTLPRLIGLGPALRLLMAGETSMPPAPAPSDWWTRWWTTPRWMTESRAMTERIFSGAPGQHPDHQAPGARRRARRAGAGAGDGGRGTAPGAPGARVPPTRGSSAFLAR